MYVKALNLIDVIVMRRAGSAHSVPTPRSYVVTDLCVDMRDTAEAVSTAMSGINWSLEIKPTWRPKSNRTRPPLTCVYVTTVQPFSGGEAFELQAFVSLLSCFHNSVSAHSVTHWRPLI